MDSRKLDLLFFTNYEKGLNITYQELVNQANTKTAKQIYKDYSNVTRSKKR